MQVTSNLTVAIAISDVWKKYGRTQALAGLALEVPKGSLVGLAGPNGAGKTTLVKIILGVTSYDSGQVTVLGLAPRTQGMQIRGQTAIVHQRSGVDAFLSVWDNVQIYIRLRGLEVAASETKARELLRDFGLEKVLQQPMIMLSGGESRKVQIVRALLLDPPLLVMDEPTASVDPESRRTLWSKVRQLTSKGTTVLWTTHDLHEMAAVSDWAFVLKGGQLVRGDTPRNLARLVGGDVIEIRGRFSEELRANITEIPAARLIRHSSTELVFESNSPEAALPRVVAVLHDCEATISAISIRSVTFEEAYVRLVGGEVR